MSEEQRDPAAGNACVEMEGRGEMTKAPVDLQDLRRRLYVKAKAEPSWRFWGIYVHVCKMETLRKAHAIAKANNGAPGIDGVTFEDIEAQGTECFLVRALSLAAITCVLASALATGAPHVRVGGLVRSGAGAAPTDKECRAAGLGSCR
jgi:hypothetical protein